MEDNAFSMQNVVMKNTDNISELTKNMATLTEVVKGVEQRHGEGLSAIREFMRGIGDKLDNVAKLDGAVSKTKEDLDNLKGDMRTVVHDFRGLQQVQAGYAALQKELIDTSARAKTNEERINRSADKLESQGRDISQSKSDITANTTDIAALKDWKLTVTTTAGNVKEGLSIFWLIFGSLIICGIIFGLKAMLAHVDPNAVLGAIGE